jgi:hypothetical protein
VTGKMKLYIGLLVLGLLLLGGGLWLVCNPVPVIDIPESPPLITMSISHRITGENGWLAIYEDGTAIHIKEKGRPPEVRIWRTGQLEQEELSKLLEFFTDSHFETLNAVYEFPGVPVPGATKVGDMYCAISIDYGYLYKTVHASQYLTPDDGMTYPDMPYPLNEVYKKLRAIIENQTEEVYRESI